MVHQKENVANVIADIGILFHSAEMEPMKIYQSTKPVLNLFLLISISLVFCLPAESAARRKPRRSYSHSVTKSKTRSKAKSKTNPEINADTNAVINPEDRPITNAVTQAKSKPVHNANLPLQEQIVSILNSSSAMRGIRTGIYIVSLKTGQVLANLRGEELFIPASNQKLFTSAAALARLKPDYCFPTIIYAKNLSPMGVVSGPLYVKGFGDPFLVNEELVNLACQLKDTGVKKVTGGLIFDDSYFASEECPQEQQGGDPSLWYRAQSGALSINFNTITFTIRPASRAGQAPLIQWDTPGRAIKVINKAVTIAGSPRKALSIGRTFQNGINSFTFGGQISVRHNPVTIYRAINVPSRYAADTLKEMFIQKGIEISGEVKSGIVPEGAKVVCQHQSKPLSDIVTSLNKVSNNFIAQQLLKAIGAKGRGAPGTSDKGIAVIREFLDETGVGAENFLAKDGCGLSKKNLTSPKKIVDLLTYVQQKSEYQPEYFSSLPIGGVDGTLKKRMRNPKVQSRVHAKTGLVNGVSCLSGYVYSYRDELIIFSIMMNNNKNQHQLCKAMQDRIVEFLLDPK